MNAYGVGTMSSPLKNNLLFASFDFHRQMENWNSLDADLRMLQRTPFNNFPLYSYLYHPYHGAFSASAYRNYLDFRHFFRSHVTMAPYAMTNHRYCCYDSESRCSIFGNSDFESLWGLGEGFDPRFSRMKKYRLDFNLILNRLLFYKRVIPAVKIANHTSIIRAHRSSIRSLHVGLINRRLVLVDDE